jgi:hypothetical protein
MAFAGEPCCLPFQLGRLRFLADDRQNDDGRFGLAFELLPHDRTHVVHGGRAPIRANPIGQHRLRAHAAQTVGAIRFKFVSFDPCNQSARLGIQTDVELLPQCLVQAIGARDGVVPSAMARRQRQQQTMGAASSRVQRRQALGEINGKRSVAVFVGLLGAAAEHSCRGRVDPVTLLPQPVRKAFGRQINAIKKRPLKDSCRLFHVFRPFRVLQRKQFSRINGDQIRVEADDVTLDAQRVDVKRREISAHRHQGLTKTLTRLTIRNVTP